ncbi:MAG: hypothetical protein V2A54_08580 [Bacteroidota bacterium]
MKTTHLILIVFAFVISLFFLSCKKQYDEGPRFSLLSAENRINGRWMVKKYYVDGTDQTQLYNDSCGCNWLIQIVFDDTDHWRMENCSIEKYNMFGFGFLFANKSNTIEIIENGLSMQGAIPPFSLQSFVITIKRLTNKEFILETTLNNFIYRFEAVSI